MTQNVVKWLANNSRVNCLNDVISQTDILSSYETGNITCWGHRGPSGTKKRRRRSVRAVMPNVLCLVFYKISWHNLRELSTLHNSTFSWNQVEERRGLGRFHDWTWGGGDCCNLHGLGSQWVAWAEKYQVLCSLWGVVSCKGAASSLVSRVSLSSPSTVSIFVYLRLRLSPS